MATLTEVDPDYEGSIGICPVLISAAGLVPGEKVHVLNSNNTNRFETYVIEGKKGEISLRGPAANLGKVGDKVIILAYGMLKQDNAKDVKAKKVYVNERNEVK